MKYACLIYSDETANAKPGTPEFGAVMEGYQAFGAKYDRKILAGEPLEDTVTATSVRVRDGEVITTDGPFAETKEHLGGFYVVEADNLDAAIAIAADIPHATTGTIEVRPVPDFG